ncbi:MAG: hypothetical protein M3245_01740 [Actinomycetota bacterium]|nr:hypothetical protein [Actinomycetota bacterium]
MTDDVETIYLGNFSRETANGIAEQLVQRKIVWWCKDPGLITQIFFAEYGVRMFVDRARLDEARAIAREVMARREAPADPDA